jgi:hypothetical protein
MNGYLWGTLITVMEDKFRENSTRARYGTGTRQRILIISIHFWSPDHNFLMDFKKSKTSLLCKQRYQVALGGRLVWADVWLPFLENRRALFDLRSVGPYGSCSDHQQIDNHRIRYLVSEIAYEIAQLTKQPFTCTLCHWKSLYSFHKINKWISVVLPAGHGNSPRLICA